jgi:hypothetical protein
MKCRICGTSRLDLILDLGSHPPSDSFLTKEQLSEPEVYYPLHLYKCQNCSLVQIDYTVEPSKLFNDTYPYETGVNSQGITHFRDLAKQVYEKCNPKTVIDIGSNDGTLLEGFKELGCEVLGVEPVKIIAENAKVKTVNKFWGMTLARKVHKVDVITATNVLAHVADIHSFVEAVRWALAAKGTFIVEAPYLHDMLNNVEYDTIYHEHLCYLALKPMDYLMRMHDMVIYNYQRLSVHGGTMRYYIGKSTDYAPADLPHENFTDEFLSEFEVKVKLNRNMINNLLWKLKLEGKRVVGASAPAKGNTLLNYCKISPQLMEYVTEKSLLKIGRYTPGMHIPVMSDEYLIKDKPDYAMVLAWNWQSQITSKLRKMGFKGKFIIPIPEPKIEQE